jgi:hypothetical protein
MKKRFQLLVLSVLCVAFARAEYVEPSEGVFRIVNVAYNAALMENYESNELRCTSIIGDADDFDQLWILQKLGSGYSIQNAYTGAYIQTGNNVQEKPYWTGTTAKTFNITKGGSGKGYNIFDPGLNKQGLHSKGANERVVRWSDCEPSEWQFEKVEVSEEAMTLAQAEYAEYLRLKIEFEDYSAELLANRDKFEEKLAKYFEDAACTILKNEFASASEENLRAAMTADSLPTELVDMAVKVKTGEWAEDNEKADKPGWNSTYAKKFRVQMIEPHSIAGEITEWIGHQGHTNMDNPTGLYANNRQVLYIMVEGEIKEGAELYATWLVGHTKMPNYNNGYGESGVRLKAGLNIVPFRTNGSALYFNYLVHTFNKDTWQFAHKLSDYDDLKIHVAGGYINGYYSIAGDSLYTPDNDNDWIYYEERANLENITILGRYEVLQFELNDVVNYTDDKGSTWSEKGLAYHFPERLPKSMPNSPAFTDSLQRINGIVEAWDRIFLSEKMTLGVASKADVDSMNKLFPRWNGTWTEKAEIYNYDDELQAFCNNIKKRDGDYGEYYNHRGVAFGTRTGYMYGSWDHSGYHINTTPSILTAIATEAGPTWGPAHEIGHQHQALYTLNGEMEVTNNTFANVAAWYMGMGTSRVNGTEGNLAHVYDNFKAGNYIFGNNIWVLTQRYYRLWLYYHRAGNNTQFFPRLFELIRKYPMERSYGSDSEMRPNDKGVMENVGFQLTNGYRSYLHFYQLCCEAAQEDLTEFFRAYGCFVPVDGVFQGDYTNSKYYTTQEEIDKAIAEVKAKNYPINNKVLFINDCTSGVTYGHDGKTRRSFWDPETGRNENGEVGLYVDYLKGTPITGEYIYTLDNLKLTIEGGKGAVGFAIYDNNGEIQAFSNNHSFSLNKKTATKLRAGEATLYAVSAKGDDVAVKNVILTESVETQLAELQTAYELATSYLEKTDTTGVKVGYLIPDSVKDYSTLVEQVKDVLANNDNTEHTFGEWYLMLDAATIRVQNSTKVRVPFIPYSFYSLTIGSNNTVRYMDNANAGLRFVENEGEKLAENLQWKFVASESGDSYYIQHRTTGKFITSVKSSQRVKAESTDMTKAVAFNLVPDAPGSFLLQCVNNEDLYLYNFVSNTNNQVYAGNQTGANAKWNIQLEDAMLELPDTSANSQITIYHLLRADNGEYAYSYMPNSPRNRGRIATADFNNLEDYNFWFYFKQGSEEGKYTMYNFATKLPVTISDENLFTNKETEEVPEYLIELNEQGTGLVISAAEGTWFINDSVEFAVVSAKDQTIWKLQRSQTIDVSNATLSSLTISKERVTLTEGDSVVLTVITAPEYAVDHSVTWSSSDESIATVDSTGKVKAIAAGSATITATANDASGLTATCKITVKKGESSVFTTAVSTVSVQSQGGVIIIDGLTEGTEVTVYSIVGKQIAAITTTGGTTTIDTGLAKGSTIIVKVGGDNFKVSIQ